MGTSIKLRSAGSVLLFSALAMVANPGASSAAITGTGSVVVDGSTFKSTITSLTTTEPFVKCEGTVYDATKTDFQLGEDPNVKLNSTAGGPKVGSSYPITGATLVAGNVLTNASGAGVSATFAPGTYWVRTKCKEGAGVSYQDPVAPVKLTIVAPGGGGGAGSSALDLFGALFG